jgi:biotin carboxylase
MRHRIAVMHHQRSYFPLDLFEQISRVADILWVVDADFAEDAGAHRILRRLGSVVDIAGLGIEQAAQCLERHTPDGILAFCDDKLVLASLLAQALGLPFHLPEVAHALVDKRLQRTILDSAGLPGPRFWPLPAGAPLNELAILASLLPYPCVVKPAEGSGSRGIEYLTGPVDVFALANGPTTTQNFVIEEYMPDDKLENDWYASYLSVETLVQHRIPSHVAITGRFPLAEPFRETGNFIPAILPAQLQEPVLNLVNAAIEALGIVNSMLHTEIKLTPDGIKLIEVNGRLGGRPPFVLNSVSDVNLFEVACANAARQRVHFDGLAPTRGVGYWLMIQPPTFASTLTAIDGVDSVRAIDAVDSVAVKRQPGELVNWRTGTDSQILTVRGRTLDHNELERTFKQIQASLELSYV